MRAAPIDLRRLLPEDAPIYRAIRLEALQNSPDAFSSTFEAEKDRPLDWFATRLADAFAESQIAIVGVSADPLRAQEAFRAKHQLSVPLVSDEAHEMLESYGVWGEKSMYGRTFQGILRTTVLIGTDGRIARIWRNVKVDGHADDVLAAARAL